MGRERLEALVRILQEQLSDGADNVIAGSWSIRWDKDIQGFYFDKCSGAAMRGTPLCDQPRRRDRGPRRTALRRVMNDKR
jgi:hypothetical protein